MDVLTAYTVIAKLCKVFYIQSKSATFALANIAPNRCKLYIITKIINYFFGGKKTATENLGGYIMKIVLVCIEGAYFMKYIKLGLDEEAHKLAMLSDGEMF